MLLYHSPGTRSTRVLWTFEELQAPYDVTALTLEERRGSGHRSRHPLGRVPVLELDDGQILFESAAICLHLADSHPAAGLAPLPGSAERPLLYQWLFFSMAELEPAVFGWRRAKRAGADESEPAVKLRDTCAALNAAVTGRAWLVGEAFSVADILAATIGRALLDTEFEAEFPELIGYVQRAVARPAFARAQAVDRPA